MLFDLTMWMFGTVCQRSMNFASFLMKIIPIHIFHNFLILCSHLRVNPFTKATCFSLLVCIFHHSLSSIVDTTAPVVTVTSSSITRQVELGTPGIEVSFTEPTATDNSGTAFLISRTAAPGDFFAVGQTTVTYTFSDAAGNTASGSVIVNVVEGTMMQQHLS